MKLRILQEGRLVLLVCSLLWQTVQGADYHDVRLGRRQDLETYIEPVTTTVTVFTQFTMTKTATVTVTPTGAVITTTTVVSTKSSTATEVVPVTTCVIAGSSGGGRRRRRDDNDGKPATTTSTTTVWQFPDATETLTITATDLQSALQVTATRYVTEVKVVTAEQTVTSSALPLPRPSSSDVSTVERPDPLGVVDPGVVKKKEEKGHGVHLAIVLGAVFGSLVGVIVLFVAGFLWVKKREEKLLELEEVAGSVSPGGGGGVVGGRVAGILIAPHYISSSSELTFRSPTGLLGSVLGSTRSSTHYNTIPDAATFLAGSRQLPPQLPPVDLDPPSDYSFDLPYGSTSQLPALYIPPPRQPPFMCEYTFGSPVSSISEGYTQTHTSVSQDADDQASWPPPPPPPPLPEVLSPTFNRERGLSLTAGPQLP